MDRRKFLHLLVASSTLALPFRAQAAQGGGISGARIWTENDKTRLVFDLGAPVQYRVVSMSQPDRLILEIQGAVPVSGIGRLALANTPVTNLHVNNVGLITRLIIDLKRPVSFNTFMLKPDKNAGHRLILDIQPNLSAAAATVAQRQTPPVQPVQPTIQPQVQQPRQPAIERRPVSARSGGRDIIVVVDAGHGGKDPGAIGADGEQEKRVVLSVATLLTKRINRQKGYRAHMVRTSDVYVPLRKRVDIARQHNADLFISVHADAAPRRTASGASVYALSERGATSAMARYLAQEENKVDLTGAAELLAIKSRDPKLAGVMVDMMTNATISSSIMLGDHVLGSLNRITGLHKPRVEQAGFAVLKAPEIPSILVETGFISNRADCARLVNNRHQQALADSIFDGLHSYFTKKPPMNTYMAMAKQSLG